MNFTDWVKKGSIRPFRPKARQVSALLKSAEKSLKAAEEILELGHYGIARDTAYESMLKCGLALMFEQGYRPEAGSHHLTIVRFVERVLGKKHAALITAFDRLRRSRHDRLYQGKELATKSQAAKAIQDATKLLYVVRRIIS